ncbi:MAG: hypothetical protein RBG13Loki_2296 [Promethearchaeota archaeon CR_4]|nr:MAG: hypothetical protein RBG13Loki_2296 [Candidatus Lokiarchaeota archaeon CR_4]
MTIFDDMTKDQLRGFLVKDWMTHDGAWFHFSCMELGIDKANYLNKKALGMLAEVEQKRLLKLMGWQDHKIRTFEDLKAMIDNFFSVVKGDFMTFEYSFPAKNAFHWVTHTCWAYEGMKKLGVEKEFQCGPLWRVMCWFKNLGIKFEMNPLVQTCLLNMQDNCEGEFRFFLD